QGCSQFDARSVLTVREHGKLARTPLAAFFNIPLMGEQGWLRLVPWLFPHRVMRLLTSCILD
ncbi:MAG: hypothetical protein VST68_01060, partial [Nitrospirota bacterium]|nr:hypothetical protein [Nitrospirota bacterium]